VKQLSGLDAAFLNLERPEAPMHVGVVTILDLARAPRGFGFPVVRRRIAERLHLLPGCRRRLVRMPLNLVPPFWMEDPDFRLDHHVQCLQVPRPGRERQLAELVAELVGKPLDRSRPLWAFYYVEGLSRRRAACISIIHHACVDGVSGTELLSKVLDLTPDVPSEPVEDGWDHDDEPSAMERVWFTARQTAARLGRLRQLVRETRPLLQQIKDGITGGDSSDEAAAEAASARPRALPGGLHPAPRTPFNVAIDATRSYAFRSLDLARIRAVKNAFGISVNDVVLAINAGALRHYLLEKGELPEEDLVAAVPISVRTRSDRGGYGNRISLLSVRLPVRAEQARERVAAVARGTAKLKKTYRAVPARLLMDWIEVPAPALLARAARLYETILHRDVFKLPINLLISNVPGSPRPLYLAGAPVTATYPFSIPYHGLALNITVLSYRGQLDVGLTACRTVVPDLDHLMDLLADSLAELEAAAGLAAPLAGSNERRQRRHRTVKTETLPAAANEADHGAQAARLASERGGGPE
jgi:WS/DGAT/MGAT family acyltransferase